MKNCRLLIYSFYYKYGRRLIPALVGVISLISVCRGQGQKAGEGRGLKQGQEQEQRWERGGRQAPGQGPGQEPIGQPAIHHYSSQAFHGGTETRGIDEDGEKVLYFANNEGLLSFDGQYWHVFPIPNRTFVRSVAVDPGGRIYVGSERDLGYFLPDRTGTLQYHSLRNLVPLHERQFADIWDVVIHGKEVFFRSFETIFLLKDNIIRAYDAPQAWRALTQAGNRLFAEDKSKGLLVFSDGIWQPACETPTAGLGIVAVTEYDGDSLLVATQQQGFFLLSHSRLIRKRTAADVFLLNDRINCIKKMSGGSWAVGTRGGGCYLLTEKGARSERISRTEGLQNNNVLGVWAGEGRSLWIGSANGIDEVEYQSPIRHIYPDRNNRQAAYSVKVFHGDLYVGTSDGLYRMPLDPAEKDMSATRGTFSQVSGTKGQVWGLSEVNHQLLAGHSEGAFLVEKNSALPIITGQGYWLYEPLSPFYPSADVIAGSYTGLELFHHDKGGFRYEGKIPGLFESLRYIVAENNAIWTSHPFRGVFRILLSEDKKTMVSNKIYGEAEGLPSALHNYVYRVKNRMVVCTEKGVYEYDAGTDRFRPSTYFRPFFSGQPVRFLKEDGQGNIWFVSNRRVGVIDFQRPQGKTPYSIVYLPELDEMTVAGSEFIEPYDKENIFIGINTGVLHLNYAQYVQRSEAPRPLLGMVRVMGEKDSVLFGGHTPRPEDDSDLNWPGISWKEAGASGRENAGSAVIAGEGAGIEERRRSGDRIRRAEAGGAGAGAARRVVGGEGVSQVPGENTGEGRDSGAGGPGQPGREGAGTHGELGSGGGEEAKTGGQPEGGEQGRTNEPGTGDPTGGLARQVAAIERESRAEREGRVMGQAMDLPNGWNSFHFEYACPGYSGRPAPVFSYQLEGFDKDWSEWSGKTEKDYTNLPYGHYTFRVRARNNAGQSSAPVAYRFSIQPAWYETKWAWILYLLAIAVGLYLLKTTQDKRWEQQQQEFREEQEKLLYLQQLELERNEKQIISLQNDKMATMISFKNKELATATMHLVERGKILSTIKEELTQRLKQSRHPAAADEFKTILRMLDDAERSDEDWDRFANHFDEVHNDFLSKLKKKLPVLSATDLKLCAYLRMNLSSKEIAQLMNISPKGVEVSRYRLRKKLEIPKEVNLFDFLIRAVE